MKFRRALLLIAIFSFVPAIPLQAASDRVALVIGNAKYPDAEAPLKEPVNDAKEIAAELKRNGFDVEIGENLAGDAMRRALERLYARTRPGSVALIFFSGFGVQSARQSYLIPVDAQIWTEPDVRRDGVSLETILSDINSRGAAVKIALIDASRRNPYERRFRSFSAGLAPVIAPNGTLVMYSAALGSVMSDTGSAHSTFVTELLKEIHGSNLTAEEVLNRTRIAIIRASRSEQAPWISSSLTEEFSFVAGVTPQASTPVAAGPARSEPPASPRDGTAAPAAVDNPPAKPAPVAPRPAATVKDEPAVALANLAEDPTIKSLTSRLMDNPDDAGARYRRGQIYASRGAYALAVNDFTEAIRLNPKDVEAYNNRCWARTAIGELQPALRDCNEALRLRPNFVDALDSRGLLNLKSGQIKNAIIDFDAALKINPRLSSSLYGRGLARQRSGAIAEGDADIANARALDPNIVAEFAGYGIH